MVMLIIIVALAPIIISEIGRRFYDLFPPKLERHPLSSIKVGDRIVYTKTKFSMHPGARARYTFPAAHGDGYSYVVDKYWIVADLLADGRLVAKTRTGKVHYLSPDDSNLHKARLVEKALHSGRFPDLALAA